MKALTFRQQQVLDLIRNSIEKIGMPPTRAELCEHFNFRSLTAAEDHLKALQKKGKIKLLPGRSRGILLLALKSASGLPLVGRVAAGTPILAEENIEEHFELDSGRFSPRADYLLKVYGQSMKDIGILDGDLLAVHRTPEALNGQVIVARLEDKITVKRFRQDGYEVTLHAENQEFDSIVVDPRETEFAIEGLGVGVIRNGNL